MLNNRNCRILQDFESLQLFLDSETIPQSSPIMNSVIQEERNEEDKISEEINIEDFMQYFDEI
jgi:hypothetical protein